MQNFEELGKELDRRGKTAELKKLAESCDSVRLSCMLDVDEAERAARNGDVAAMQNIVKNVMQTEEGKRLADSIMKLMQD